MRTWWCRVGLLLVGVSLAASGETAIDAGFVHVDEVAPEVVQELRYATTNNFVGERIDGYEAGRALLTRPAAEALQAVAAELQEAGLRLKLFDAYRPQRAVMHFVRWAQDTADTRTKADYYPRVAKADLFKLGYIALESGHSRGSTVDLTLLEQTDDGPWREVDMGTPFDFFGEEAASRSKLVSEAQQVRRRQLREVMERHGWVAYEAEWWHFTLGSEPYPETYFDFPVR